MKKLLKLTLITGIIFSILSFGTLSVSAACPLTNMFGSLFGGGNNSFGNIGSLFGNNNYNDNSSCAASDGLSNFGNLGSLFGNNNYNNNSSCAASDGLSNFGNLGSLFGNNNYNNNSSCAASGNFGNIGNFGGSNCYTGTCITGNCETAASCTTGNCQTTPSCTTGNCVTAPSCTTGNCINNSTNCYGGYCLTDCTSCTNCADCPECPQCEEDYYDETPDVSFELEKGFTYSLKVDAKGSRNLTVKSSDTSVVTARLRGGYINDTAIIYLQAKGAGCATVEVCPANSKIVCEIIYICVVDDNYTVQPPVNSSCDTFAEEVLLYVNQARAQNGLSALALDANLCEAAKVRAKEVAVRFSHTRPDNSSCFTVLDEFGINYKYCGENIALGYNDAKTVVNGWLNSSSHRANILNPNYKYMGLGKIGTGWGQLFIG